MIGFVAGALAGGAIVWFWGDRMRQLARDKTEHAVLVAGGRGEDARDTVARGLESVQATAESAFDSAKEQIRTGLQAGQDYVRPDDKKAPPSYR